MFNPIRMFLILYKFLDLVKFNGFSHLNLLEINIGNG